MRSGRASLGARRWGWRVALVALLGCGTGPTPVDPGPEDPGSAVARITLSPNTLTLAPGEVGQFTATVLGPADAPSTARVLWSSSNPGVASIDQAGRVTAWAQGAIQIRAQAGDLSRTRGVTVSTTPNNLWLARADLIQVAQTASADVPLVRGKPTAVRLFPQASSLGFTNVPIEVTLSRFDAQLFRATILSGPIPVATGPQVGGEGIFLPLPPGLNLEGALLRARIDPDNLIDERDEWDNYFPTAGELPEPIVLRDVGAPRIRLVGIAPAGGTPPTIDPGSVDGLAEFMRTVYPTASVEVTVRTAGIVSARAWTTRQDLAAALAEVEVQRVADGWAGHYYGVHAQGTVDGVAGLGYASGRSAIGPFNDVVFAHEVGHNFGLLHAPGCGATETNAAYPTPGGEIGLRGYDARSGAVVPATAIDLMGYCPGPRWLSGTHFVAMLGAMPSALAGAALVAAPSGEWVPLAVTGVLGPEGPQTVRAWRLEAAAAFSAAEAGALVEVLDGAGAVLATFPVRRQEVAEGGEGAELVAAVLPLTAEVAARARRVRVRVGGESVEAGIGP
ncbi:MAG: Ig-like domain-containing protein [Gemmatimonadales bacterium]